MLRAIRKLGHTKTKFAKPMSKAPTDSEGTNGEVRVVKDTDGVRLYAKYNGKWYSTTLS